MEYTLLAGKNLRREKGNRLGGQFWLKPLPLSCICHIVGIGMAGMLVGLFHTPAEPVRTTPEIAVELIAANQVTGSGEAGNRPAAMPAIQNPAAAPKMVHSSENGETAREIASPASPAPITGTAAGSSSGESAAGTSVAGSSGESSVAGSDSGIDGTGEAGAAATAGTVVAASDPVPTESLGSIASRFAARVEANKEYPYMAIKRGDSGVVSVTVTLSSDGSLQSVYVSSSAGINLLDNAALQAVRNSCPFSHGAARSITMTVPIHFDLQ